MPVKACSANFCRNRIPCVHAEFHEIFRELAKIAGFKVVGRPTVGVTSLIFVLNGKELSAVQVLDCLEAGAWLVVRNAENPQWAPSCNRIPNNCRQSNSCTKWSNVLYGEL